MPLGSVARSSVTLALPLVLGALAGVLCERSAVINVAIEGQFLMGAFAAAMFATLAGSVWIGILAAGVGGLIIGAAARRARRSATWSTRSCSASCSTSSRWA